MAKTQLPSPAAGSETRSGLKCGKAHESYTGSVFFNRCSKGSRQDTVARHSPHLPAKGHSGAAIDWKRNSRTESRPLNDTSGIRPYSKMRLVTASVSKASAQGFSSETPPCW